jgi:hypothetical protein
MVLPKLVKLVHEPVAVKDELPPGQSDALVVIGGGALVIKDIGPTHRPLFAPQLDLTQT